VAIALWHVVKVAEVRDRAMRLIEERDNRASRDRRLS
jgi:hypothetical protein